MNTNTDFILEHPPINIKNNCSFDKLYNIDSCNVSVIWIIYDKRKKLLIKDYQGLVDSTIEKYRFMPNKKQLNTVEVIIVETMKYIFGDIQKQVILNINIRAQLAQN